MALKLALNTVSTGTMVKFGRVSGNWMSHVSISNKKLIDRGIRLLAELGNLEYADACYALFEAVEAMKHEHFEGNEPPSAVQYALRRLRSRGI
ncbi:N-acetylmuramic acid 6-phosphate etherase [bioreactor metagenome]|uniref:N-acetylmuramic acid 6-phosphate etherase n=1 Tax=bioreactor metagenome TaxID=1076179 RepID=A0A645GP13_9ZZZZ